MSVVAFSSTKRALSLGLTLPTYEMVSQGLAITLLASLVDLDTDPSSDIPSSVVLGNTGAAASNTPPAPPPSNREWHHLLSDRTPTGPVDEGRIAEMIRMGSLQRDSLVWCTGMTQWAEISSVPELRSFFMTAPPPVPPPPLPVVPAKTPSVESVQEFVWPDHGIPWNPKIQYGLFVDPRDGHKYRTVKIGKQTWLAENLAFNAPGSWVYENKPENEAKYGHLYD